MKRIAYASPINPAPSGISDYSEELLPYLGQYADITVYIDDGLRPTNQHVVRHLAVRQLKHLERDHRAQPFDAVVYHMGNSPVHAPIWNAMQRTPGVVVLHEFVLNHFMLNYAAVVQRDVTRYEAEAARRYGAEGERVAKLMMRGRLTDAAFDFPFSEGVLEAAQGLISHSRYVLEKAAAVRPNLPAAHIPMGVPLPPQISRDQARGRLGIPTDAPVLASFGHINPYKRIEPVLRALRLLRATYPNLRYILVGSVSPNYDLRSVVGRQGLENAVTITGYVERAAFEDYVAAADICLNLRHPTAGETSASLLRLLGAGRPTLVTASGSFTELPRDVAAQVDPDPSEGDLIIAYCHLLLSRPDIAAQLGAQARAYVAREHTLEGAARGYMRFLSSLNGWGDVRRERERPLWSVTDEDREPKTANRQPNTNDQPASVGEQVPQHTAISPGISEAVAGIGATEDDTALLKGVAKAAAELGYRL